MKHVWSAAAPDHPVRRRGSPPLFAALGAAVIAGAAALAMTSWVACTRSDDFKCGIQVPGDPNTFRQCDVTHQICVCRTNACAEPAEECDAGFRYVDGPFAPMAERGKCVEAPLGTWFLRADAKNAACGEIEDAGTGGRDGAGTSSNETGGSGGAGTSSSATGGSGGAGTSSTSSSSSSVIGAGGAGGGKGS